MNTRERDSGFSLLELIAGLTFLTLGLAAFSGAFLSTARQAEETHQTNLGTAAVRNTIEILRGAEFYSVASYFGPAGNSIFWCGPDGSVTFTDPGDATVSGQIIFYTDESSIPSSFADMDAGFDLNGNGTIEGIVSDYEVLPVRLVLGGTVAMTVDYVLRPRNPFE